MGLIPPEPPMPAVELILRQELEPVGWVCPICGRVNAPQMIACTCDLMAAGGPEYRPDGLYQYPLAPLR